MKLRIKGNSLRLRVSRSELDRLMTGNSIEETIHFGSESDAHLIYALEAVSNSSAISVRYLRHRITVILPENDLRIWNEANQVGVYASVDSGPKGPLELIVEKDFACLDGSDEENHDTFENPLSRASC